MILDLAYISQDCYTFNQVRFKLIYLLSSLDTAGLHMWSFYYLVNIFIFIWDDKANIYTKKKL